MMILGGVGRADDFYEARLRAGKEAYRQKHYREAIDQLRVAAFGTLETPPLLSEILARLALAESAAGRSGDVASTLSRFLEVERRFSAYAKVRLEPEIAVEFKALLLQRVPPATLQSLAGLAGLVETEEQKAERLPPKERRKALEAGLRHEPSNVAWPLGLARDSAQRLDHKDVLQWTAKALQVAPGNAEALALQAHARSARGDFPGALADLKALPAAELDARPELRADKFVCLVEGGDWSGAQGALKAVPADLMARSDVARANQKLAAELTHRPREIADKASAKTPSKNPPNPPRPAPAPSPASSTVGRATGGQSKQATTSQGSPSPAQAVLAESRRLVQALKATEAAKILLEELKSEPDNRGLRVALLEAYCLSGAWSRGAEQVPLLAPFADGEALPMFYAAVVLYQTGRTEEARGYMARAMPRVSGPLVDEYAKRILGQS